MSLLTNIFCCRFAGIISKCHQPSSQSSKTLVRCLIITFDYIYIIIIIYIYIYIHIQGVVQLCYPLLSLITNRDLHVEYHVPLGKLQLRMQGCCHHHKATTPMTQRQHHWRSYKLRLKRWKLELRWSVWDPDGSRFV